MQLLFIADPLESFKTTKDTTFSMMREAQRRGHTIAACEPQDVMWERGDPVMAHVRDIVLTGRADGWFSVREREIEEKSGLRTLRVIVRAKRPARMRRSATSPAWRLTA